MGEDVSQEFQACAEVALAVLDQSVGEQGQPAALWQVQCGGFDREAAAMRCHHHGLNPVSMMRAGIPGR